jgi:hypothetical protein
MNKLQQTLITLKTANAWLKSEDQNPYNAPNADDVGLAIDYMIEIGDRLETFLTNRQKNNCSSACSPLVSIAEGA